MSLPGEAVALAAELQQFAH